MHLMDNQAVRSIGYTVVRKEELFGKDLTTSEHGPDTWPVWGFSGEPRMDRIAAKIFGKYGPIDTQTLIERPP